MAVGKTNAVSGTKTKYILANTFDPDETYYERILTPYNPSRVEGTYLFVDKSYCGSIRTNSNRFYGNGGDGGVAHIFILEGKEPSQTTAGEWAWISNFKIWGLPSTSVMVNYGMDNGNNNGGTRMDFYNDMKSNLKVNYNSNYVLMSIFDSSILENLRDFTDLCTVKVSDYIMGTDFQNRAGLLALEGKTSIASWIEEITSYNEIELTSSTFVPFKYFKKILDE